MNKEEIKKEIAGLLKSYSELEVTEAGLMEANRIAAQIYELAKKFMLIQKQDNSTTFS